MTVDAGQDAVSAAQPVPVSLWSIFMPPLRRILNKITDMSCPPDAISPIFDGYTL